MGKNVNIGLHNFCFNDDENGGQQLFITTSATQTDDGVSFTQEISLETYMRSVSLHVPFDFTPENLRRFADELQKFRNDMIAHEANVEDQLAWPIDSTGHGKGPGGVGAV